MCTPTGQGLAAMFQRRPTLPKRGQGGLFCFVAARLRVAPACDWADLVMGGILSEHLPQLFTLLDCLRAL